ncbi:GNAT family N-acetyltransferase [Aspergillus lucknowensis]|uniref:Acyl-CoA N-acyltransferase n=1 Tax=Aspergillus lucknowensis TaxID=176173 RepID=A0ABR4LP12_9EURO
MASFEIHPTTVEDLYETQVVSEAAFGAHLLLIFSGPLSEESRTAITQTRASVFNVDPHARRFKAVDPATGKIIGVCYWTVHAEEEELTKSIEDVVAARMKPDIPERRKEASRAYYTMLTEGKREVLGLPDSVSPSGNGNLGKLKKRIDLDVMLVHPEYQRRGVGSALLNWGIQESKRLELPLFVEASEDGRLLYERSGFQPIKVGVLDSGKLDGVGSTSITFMMRPVEESRDGVSGPI